MYDLAVSEGHKALSGKYFENDVYAKAHPDAYNETAIQKLIEVTNNLIKKRAGGSELLV